VSGKRPLRVLIVDDERWARRRLAALLRDEADVEIVGQCADGPSAVEAIAALRPDLVLLDVQMPGMDGFEVIEAVGAERFPAVIFATAYEEYAVRAFDAHAVDYLLKPIDEERFRRAMNRARRTASGEVIATAGIRTLLASLGERPRHLRWLAVHGGSRVVLVAVAEVDWLEADGNYVKVHTAGRAYLLRDTMQSLESKLDPECFLRVHRSAIVNLARVREIQPWFRGEQVLVMRDGARISVGRRFRGRLDRILDNLPVGDGEPPRPARERARQDV
jgi:two-component system, LytTR family, response regulator